MAPHTSLPAPFSAAQLTELLAPTLGVEKSVAVIRVATTRLRLPDEGLTLADAQAVLDDLSTTPGMVGIAARFARTRLEVARVDPVRPSVPPPSEDMPVSGVASTRRSLTLRELATLCAPTLGKEKADEVVRGAVRQLQLPGDRLDKAQALAVLDHLAAEPGPVGLSARFAKARLLLRFAA